MNKEEAIKYLQQLYPNGGHCWLDEQRIEAIGMAINALQEEPVSKQNLSNVERTVKNWKEPVSEDLGAGIKRIYLSGPISGHDLKERQQAFAETQQRLESVGWEVVNPMRNGLPADSPTHQHMKRDFELLLTCDTIYMMRRWLHSAGCKLEFDVATAIGLPVIFEEGGGIVQFG